MIRNRSMQFVFTVALIAVIGILCAGCIDKLTKGTPISGSSPARTEIPPEYGPIEIPWYFSGQTEACWAAGLQMLTRAATPKGYYGNTFAFISATNNPIDLGLTPYDASNNPNLEKLVSDRTKLVSDRTGGELISIFNPVPRGADYRLPALKGIISQGYPVAVVGGGHTWVLVGYGIFSGGDNFGKEYFYVLDPSGTTAYDRILPQQIGLSWPTTFLYIKKLDPKRPLVTITINNGGIQFIGKNLLADTYTFFWYPNNRGYGFAREPNTPNTREIINPIPSTVEKIRLTRDGPGIEVVNSNYKDRKPKRVYVYVTISSGSKTLYDVPVVIVNVPSGESRKIKFNEIPVAKFRIASQSPEEYVFRAMAYVLDGNSLDWVDEARFEFVLEPEKKPAAQIAPQGCPQVDSNLKKVETKREIYYTDSKGLHKQGPYISYYDDTRKLIDETGCFLDGLYTGHWIYYHENGKKWMEGDFKASQRTGHWTEWYKNGKKSREGVYKDGGLETGRWTYWYENGNKYEEGDYKDGKKTGHWQVWLESGLEGYPENY